MALFCPNCVRSNASVKRPTNPKTDLEVSPVSTDACPPTGDGNKSQVKHVTFDSRFSDKSSNVESQAELPTLIDDGATGLLDEVLTTYKSIYGYESIYHQCSDEKRSAPLSVTPPSLTTPSSTNSPDYLSSNSKCRCSCHDNDFKCDQTTIQTPTSLNAPSHLDSLDSPSSKNKEHFSFHDDGATGLLGEVLTTYKRIYGYESLFHDVHSNASATRQTNPKTDREVSPVCTDANTTQVEVYRSEKHVPDETFNSGFSEKSSKNVESLGDLPTLTDDSATSLLDEVLTAYKSIYGYESIYHQCSDDKRSAPLSVTPPSLTTPSSTSSPDSFSSNSKGRCSSHGDYAMYHDKIDSDRSSTTRTPPFSAPSLTTSPDSLAIKNEDIHGCHDDDVEETNPHVSARTSPSLPALPPTGSPDSLSAKNKQLCSCRDDTAECHDDTDSDPNATTLISSSLSSINSPDTMSIQPNSHSVQPDSISNRPPAPSDDSTSSIDQEKQARTVHRVDIFETAREKGICLEDMELTEDGCGFEGTVVVRNDKFDKCVSARYTNNNWVTYQDILAEWMETIKEGEFDRFKFVIPVGEEGDSKMEIPHDYVTSCTSHYCGYKLHQKQYILSFNHS